MNTEQREEIENAIKELEDSKDIGVIDSLTWPEIRTLIQFARQQLNLRVDGEKLMNRLIESEIFPSLNMEDSGAPVFVWPQNAPEQLEALVLECLTTTPEEKE